MRYAALFVMLGACTDAAVDMQLVAPSNAAQLDTSCITSIEVHVNGPSFPADPQDVHSSCIELSGPAASYDALIEQIRGKFTLAMPYGGLSGVEVYGWAGACPNANDPPPYLMFYSSQSYIGQDALELQIIPNLDCKPTQVKLHLVDLMKLTSGTNPTDANCTAAAVPDSPNTGAGTVTLMPSLFGKSVDTFGNAAASAHDSVATVTMPSMVGSKSCLGTYAFSDNGDGLECLSSTPSVCAASGEAEAPIVSADIAGTSMQSDPNRAHFPSAILGTVWTGTTSKHPAVGATIDIDPSLGAVEYVDPPDTGSAALKPRTAGATGSSGMFLLFTNTVVTANVSFNGKQTPVTMSADPGGPGGMIVVVN